MSYKIVISRYNENIDWLNNLQIENVIIYNKGNDYIPGAIPRKNIGMNIETMFNYIVENYNNLPDYIFFLQGNPFDHILKEITQINIQKYIDNIVNSNPDKIFPFYVNYLTEYESKLGLGSSYRKLASSLRISEYWNLFFNEPYPQQVSFAHGGAQYIIPKNIIKLKPIEFYSKILHMIEKNTELSNYDPHNNNLPFYTDRINAWSLERLIYYFFSKETTINQTFLNL